MFRVKICGIRGMEDYLAVADSGVDAIGLNFYEQSKRCVFDLQSAREIAANAQGKMLRIGLYVNYPANGLFELVDKLELDAVQAHGNEDAVWFRTARQLGIPLIRAIRSPATAELLREEIGKVPADLYDVLLIDGSVSGSAAGAPVYGGSGALANWQAIREVRDSIKRPLILAGGLTPQNVREAIETVGPDGVDVAGGVEGASGEKDANKAAQFTSTAKAALAGLAK